MKKYIPKFPLPFWLRQQWRDYVKQSRRARQWTRRELAKRANLDPSNVTLWEDGDDNTIPSREYVTRVGRALEDLPAALEAAGFRSGPNAPPPPDLRLSQRTRQLLDHLAELSYSDQDALTHSLLLAFGAKERTFHAIPLYPVLPDVESQGLNAGPPLHDDGGMGSNPAAPLGPGGTDTSETSASPPAVGIP